MPAPSPETSQQSVIAYILSGVVQALCQGAGAGGESRERQAGAISALVMAFQPRDAVEAMLAGLIVTHVHLIQDTTRHNPRENAKIQSALPALGRVLMGLMKELRLARARLLDGNAPHPALVPPPRAAPGVKSPARSSLASYGELTLPPATRETAARETTIRETTTRAVTAKLCAPPSHPSEAPDLARETRLRAQLAMPAPGPLSPLAAPKPLPFLTAGAHSPATAMLAMLASAASMGAGAVPVKKSTEKR